MPTGTCLCKKVRYEVRGELFGIWFCHCSKCRRSSGGAFVAAAGCRSADFRWLGEPPPLSEYATDSGYRRRFCSSCGSPAPLHLAGTSFVWLPAGSLEGDPGVHPRHHIFVGSKAPWLEIADSLPQFDEHASEDL